MKTDSPLDSALDDRLGIVGTAGSGKTYGAGTGVEKILLRRGRCIIPDPLGVWWGLRLTENGKPSDFDVVIFGGPHGDLPLNEHAGALIGETVAGMKESAIVDLSELGTKAAERRFMLAFLTALYKHASGDPVHVIFDEADMWAPQKLLGGDREAEPAKLLGMMETVVRRGRIKGFIPWLITQRPAVISKDVLSQVDGLVAFKLTSSQDRAALGAWVEGQADQGQWKEISDALPTLPRGEAVVWLPAKGSLQRRTFPSKSTFDSSRTPKRGEAKRIAELKPLDLGALKERLSSVQKDAEANDPKKLRADIARLERELAAAKKAPAVDKVALNEEYTRGRADGWEAAMEVVRAPLSRIEDLSAEITHIVEHVPKGAVPAAQAQQHRAPPPARAPTHTDSLRAAPAHSGRVAATPSDSSVTRPQQHLLETLAMLESIGLMQPRKTQLALWADVSPTSGGFAGNLGVLREAGLIAYPSGGAVALTDAGRERAPTPTVPAVEEMHEALCAKVGAGKAAILRALIAIYPRDIGKNDLAEKIGVSPTSGGYAGNLGDLRSLGVIDYPAPGRVVALPVLFLEG